MKRNRNGFGNKKASLTPTFHGRCCFLGLTGLPTRPCQALFPGPSVLGSADTDGLPGRASNMLSTLWMLATGLFFLFLLLLNMFSAVVLVSQQQAGIIMGLKGHSMWILFYQGTLGFEVHCVDFVAIWWLGQERCAASLYGLIWRTCLMTLGLCCLLFVCQALLLLYFFHSLKTCHTVESSFPLCNCVHGKHG